MIVDMMTPEFLSRLDGLRKTSRGWRACCPAHDDRNPSLDIAVGDDGRLLLKCRSRGCSAEAIVSAVGCKTADLFATPSRTPLATKPPNETKARGAAGQRGYASIEAAVGAFIGRRDILASRTTPAVYEYRSGGGAFWIVRYDFDPPCDGQRKTFRPYHMAAGHVVDGDPPGALPLYKIEEATRLADRDSVPILVIEGEKDVDQALSLGWPATTSAHGSNSAKKTDWSRLAGRRVCILPDHDDAGEHYADDVIELLGELHPRPTVSTARVPVDSIGADLTDWIETLGDGIDAHGAISELVESAEPIPYDDRGGLVDAPRRWVPFPVDELPVALRNFVRSASDAVGCDPALVALPVLSVCASAVGRSRMIELKRSWHEPSILWTAIIADSGCKKTPAMRVALRPLKVAQDLGFDALSGEQTPVPRFIVSDTTAEALCRLLSENPRGLLIAKDELSGWIANFDRYSNGRGGGDVAFWLSAHNAESVLVDRKADASGPVRAASATVSVTGGIQPGTFVRALTDQHRQNGLLARMLLAWPPKRTHRWSDRSIPEDVERAYGNVISKLLRLHCVQREGDAFAPVSMPLTSEALTEWVRFYDEHAERIAQAAGDAASMMAKLEGAAARLALVVHCVRSVSEPDVSPDEVDAGSVRAGVAIAEWFADEAERCYGLFEETDGDRQDRELVDWIVSRGGSVTARELQGGIRRYRASGAAASALDRLADAGVGVWQTPSPTARGGPPRRAFVLV